jgi:RNA polymerase sigma factor (sigma-70 family)
VNSVEASEIDLLVSQALNGNDSAFNRLAVTCRPFINRVIRRWIKQSADIENVTQETLLSASQAIKNGQYSHTNSNLFFGWLRTIAHNKAIHYLRSEANAPLSNIYLHGDVEVILDFAAEDYSVEAEMEQLWLAEFLDQQLDEVLIVRESTKQGKDHGLLKKIAFKTYYVDERSQRETVDAVTRYAAALHMSATINQTMINNWIARGDILKGLVRHLVMEHHELLTKLMAVKTVTSTLSEQEQAYLDDCWLAGRSVDQIAAKSHTSTDEVERRLKSAKQKVADNLYRVIKQQLHLLRHRRG